MAWRPDRAVRGPERVSPREIDALNRLFADAFTDRYRRDGLSGVRVPQLNPLIWRYALEDAGEGGLVWRDPDGDLCAFNIVHLSGREGWMGPLAVRPDRQGAGLGKAMLRTGIAWLREHGARTIGLETMPRTVENIGFYGGLGFVPGYLTITLVKELVRGPARLPELLSAAGAGSGELLAACRDLAARVVPGADYTREITLTAELGIGDTLLLRNHSGDLSGFALCHTVPLAAGRPRDELRVLKLVARDAQAFEAVLQSVEAAALGAGVNRVSLRCQTAQGEAYLRLGRLGYRVHWTDLRMTLAGHGEPLPEGGGVAFSNWEI